MHMISDLHRYLYVSTFGSVYTSSPKLEEFPSVLIPNHKNATQAVKGGKVLFGDRFKVQMKEKTCSTIVAHLKNDGHHFIHYDPAQCRSITVREAARVQSFQDDYFFCGTLGKQFEQVGNAVPPLIAEQLAGLIYEIIINK